MDALSRQCQAGKRALQEEADAVSILRYSCMYTYHMYRYVYVQRQENVNIACLSLNSFFLCDLLFFAVQ